MWNSTVAGVRRIGVGQRIHERGQRRGGLTGARCDGRSRHAQKHTGRGGPVIDGHSLCRETGRVRQRASARVAGLARRLERKRRSGSVCAAY
jgi:hypothetical protein